MFLQWIYLKLYCCLFLCCVKVTVLLVSYFFCFSSVPFLKIDNRCLYYVKLFFEIWYINELMILFLFLSGSISNHICSSRWFIYLSDVSLVAFTWIRSPGAYLTHAWENLFLKLLPSIKNEFFIFLNSSKICNLRFTKIFH